MIFTTNNQLDPHSHAPRGNARRDALRPVTAEIASLYPRRGAWERGRGGFTLLELTVVLAVMVVVAAVSWPAFKGWFQSHRLRQGVDAVRAQLVKARTLALEEGRPYRFAWMPESGGYRLAPHNLEYWPDAAETSASVPFAEAGTAPGFLVEDSLPEGVRFTSWDASSPQAVGGWCAETVLFWPDGTARIYMPNGAERPDIQLFLADPAGQATVLQLRALTGGVTVLNVRRP